MARWLLLVGVLAFAVSSGACSQGDECDKCSTDSDCDAGLYCRNFEDEDTGELVGKFCGSGQGSTTCRIR